MTECVERRPGFESPYPVALTQAPGGWETTAPLLYRGTVQDFTVPAGQDTDLASVPAVLTWAVKPDEWIPAAVVHDRLWRVEVPTGQATYRDADGLLRQALGTLNVPPLRAHLIWTAVRWGALTRRNGWRGWHRDAPKVLPLTIIGALFFAVPVLVTLPFLALYAVVESIVTILNRKEKP